jgi:hypothetical protein
VDGAAHLGAVGHPHHDGAAGEGAEVDADRELVGAGHAHLPWSSAHRTAGWTWMLSVTIIGANPLDADMSDPKATVVLSECYR